jgi:hypothetical protein
MLKKSNNGRRGANICHLGEKCGKLMRKGEKEKRKEKENLKVKG